MDDADGAHRRWIMGSLFQDIQYGVRMLVKNPGFTAVAIITLMLGIGANSAIFSVINAVLLRPLAFKDPDRLVTVKASAPGLDPSITTTSGPDFIDWKNQNDVFQYLAATDEASFNLTDESAPERVQGATVSADLFQLLGVSASLGRAFAADEEQNGRNKVAVISHDLWKRRFGSDPTLIGRTIKLDGDNFAIIGVMPAGFRFPEGEKVDIWAPIAFDDKYTNNRGHHSLF